MTRNYKALALGAGIAAALALSACGRQNRTAPGAQSGMPATSGAQGTMGAAPESGAPAASSAPANPPGG